MENQVQLFNHPEFGGVRVVNKNEPWFVGKDVAEALGYSNPNDALAKYVPDKYKINGVTETFISLNGISELANQSKSSNAEDFEWWIATEVTSLIETICAGAEEYDVLFKNIYYLADILRIYANKAKSSSIDRLSLILNALANARTEANLNPEKKCVYVLKMNNGAIKIGCTKNFICRARQVETASGLKIINWCHTDYILASQAYAVESRCHNAFNEHRILGEFFAITFEDACAELSKYESITESKDLFGGVA